MRMTLLLAASLLMGCAGQPHKSAPTATPLASQTYDISKLSEAIPHFAPVGTEKVLVVFDIDDTLLTSPRFFGSDRWVLWQFDSSTPAADKVACIFDVAAVNYEAGTQVATEQDAPAVVAASTGDTLFLTSRSPAARNATLRELDRAKIRLPKALGDGKTRSYTVVDDKGRTIRVGYDEGIFTVAGQKKGKMLFDLLNELQLSYDRIVVVDDGAKNVQRIIDAFQTTSAVVGLHYTGVKNDNNLPPVTQAEIDDARASRQALDKLMALAYPKRVEAINKGECWEK